MKATMKKVLSMLVVIATVAAISIGGTLAYLTDRDSKANVFTIGDVSISLNEEFEQGSALVPNVHIDKEVTVTNTGKNDAWVWYTITYPKAIDVTDSGKTILWTGFTTENHDNAGYAGANDSEDEWLIEYTGAPYLRYFPDDNGIEMVEFTVLYQSKLTANETTPTSLEVVYLDKNIDIDPNGDWYRVENGITEKINWNSNINGNPVIYISAYAMQTEGFNTVQDAYAAYNKQWGSNGSEYAVVPTLVSTADELQETLNNGGYAALTNDINMNGMRVNVPEETTATIDLNGYTLTSKDGGIGNWMAIYVDDNAELTLEDSVGTGEIISSCYGVYVQPNATFIMNGGTLSVSGNGTYDIGVNLWNGKFIMNGGTINAQYGVWASNYYKNTDSTLPVCEVTIDESCTINSILADIDIIDATDTIINVPSEISVYDSEDDYK